MKTLNASIEAVVAPQRSVKIQISAIFFPLSGIRRRRVKYQEIIQGFNNTNEIGTCELFYVGFGFDRFL